MAHGAIFHWSFKPKTLPVYFSSTGCQSRASSGGPPPINTDASNRAKPCQAVQVIRAAEAMGDADDAAKGLKAMLAATPRLTSCAQIDELIATLTTRRTDMQSQQQETKLHLLLHFLEKARCAPLRLS